jgi:hypothetical protein
MLYVVAIFVINFGIVTSLIGIVAFWIYSAIQKINGKPNIFLQPSILDRPIWFSVILGLKLSIILSITYAFFGVFIVENFTRNGTDIFGNFLHFLFTWALGSPFIFLAAILPAVIYGVFTSLLLALLIGKFKHLFSSITSILLGIAFCAVITALTHFIFSIPVVLSFANTSTDYMSFGVYETYPFFIGIPSIIYTLAGGWASWRIYKKLKAEQIAT